MTPKPANPGTASAEPRPARSTLAHLLPLIAGVFACSTAVLFIKASTTHPVLLSGYRLILAALLLAPLAFRSARRHGFPPGLLLRTLQPGVALALHFITWTLGARGTDAANATLLVNLTPIVMPLLLFAGARERVTRREIVGTVIAMAGVLILTAGDYVLRRENLAGDGMCLVSMLLFAWYFALGRRNRDFPSLWLYVVPVYAVAGLVCFALAPIWTNPLRPLPGRELLLMLGLATIPTIIGHSLLNQSLKHLRGQVVTLVNLGQFLFAAGMAWILLRETPQPAFYAAAALIGAGAWIALRR